MEIEGRPDRIQVDTVYDIATELHTAIEEVARALCAFRGQEEFLMLKGALINACKRTRTSGVGAADSWKNDMKILGRLILMIAKAD